MMDVIINNSSSIPEYEFSWTIEHFSSSLDIVRGPSFSTIPGFRENVCIELHFRRGKYWRNMKFNRVIVSLIDLNVEDSPPIFVSSCISWRRTNGNILKKATTSRTKFKRNLILLQYCKISNALISNLQLSQIMKLLDDTLVVKGRLSFSKNDVALKSRAAASSLTAYEDLSNDFKTVYLSGSSSDITFSVGEKTLRAHKHILISRSPVFAKMFESDMLESHSNNVVIEDADFHVFNCFLMFLYTGIVEDKKCDTVVSLYSLAHKYQVTSLHGICSEILSKSLAIDCACSVLVLSDLHGDQELTDVAKGFIRSRINQVAATTEWAEIVLAKPHLAKEVLPSMDSQTIVT